MSKHTHVLNSYVDPPHPGVYINRSGTRSRGRSRSRRSSSPSKLGAIVSLAHSHPPSQYISSRLVTDLFACFGVLRQNLLVKFPHATLGTYWDSWNRCQVLGCREHQLSRTARSLCKEQCRQRPTRKSSLLGSRKEDVSVVSL